MKFVLLLIALFGAAIATQDCLAFSQYCSLDGSCPNADSNSLTIDGSTYSFSSYDLISYGNLKMRTGDVQGRAAVKGDFTAVEEGVSFGDQLSDAQGLENPYSFVVGGNANILNGEIYPANSGAFIGGSFSGQAANIKARTLANCSSSGCLDQYFANSKSYYVALSEYLASKDSNVEYSLAFGTITLNCAASAQIYYVSVPGSDFSQIISYASVGCSADALWVFNIAGAGDVKFDGNPFQRGSIYNILGSRAVFAQTFIYGSVLCPNAQFNQTAGTVFGAVIAGDVGVLTQVNVPDCPATPPATQPPATQPPATPSPAPATTGAETPAPVPVTTGKEEEHATTGKQEEHATTGAAETPVPATTGAETLAPTPATTGADETPVTSGYEQLTSGYQQFTSGYEAATSGYEAATSGQEAPATTGSECVCPPVASSSSTSGVVGTSTGTTGSTPVPPTQAGTCPVDDLEDQCAGITGFTLEGNTVDFGDYHVVVFGDLSANTGDIEGRAAVQGDVTFGNGFAVGTQVAASDSASYSLIADNLVWGSGALDPAGAFFFAAGSVSAPAYIASQRSGSACNASESSCLDSGFNNAQQCYFDFQDQLEAEADNVDYEAKFSTLSISCNSASDSTHYMTVAPSALDQITFFQLSGCNADASWVININGTADVDFHGGSFPSKPENVIYNIVGEGRTITVNTAVLGSILAPGNNLNQTRGVVVGKVVVNNAYVLQINKIACPAVEDNADEKAFSGASAVVVPSVFVAAIVLIASLFM